MNVSDLIKEGGNPNLRTGGLSSKGYLMGLKKGIQTWLKKPIPKEEKAQLQKVLKALE